MPKVDRDGFQIHYEVTCDRAGPTLVLVAGLGEQIGAVEYPDEQCAHFARKGFRVVRVDNRDSGLSTVPERHIGDYSLHDVADDILSVIEDLAVGPVYIVGASMGGFIVRWAAMDFLLDANKKNRRRVQLENFIILALRCLAMLLIGLLLARPFLPNALVDILKNTKRFERIVVLDDSPSMLTNQEGG